MAPSCSLRDDHMAAASQLLKVISSIFFEAERLSSCARVFIYQYMHRTSKSRHGTALFPSPIDQIAANGVVYVVNHTYPPCLEPLELVVNQHCHSKLFVTLKPKLSFKMA